MSREIDSRSIESMCCFFCVLRLCFYVLKHSFSITKRKSIVFFKKHFSYAKKRPISLLSIYSISEIVFIHLKIRKPTNLVRSSVTFVKAVHNQLGRSKLCHFPYTTTCLKCQIVFLHCEHTTHIAAFFVCRFQKYTFSET